MKWEKNISITSLNRFNYVLVLNQLEELLSNIKTEVTTLTLTLVHLTPVSGRLAKKKPWYNPSRTPENQPASRDAPSRQRPPANRNESGQCSSEDYWTACTFTTKEKRFSFADYSVSHLLRSKASEMGLLKEAKTTSSENSTLAAPAAKETQCHYHRSWHRCWCDSHSINSRNLLPLLAQITGLSGTELHCYIYIPYYTCRVCWIACYLITIMLLLLRVNTIWGVKCL